MKFLGGLSHKNYTIFTEPKTLDIKSSEREKDNWRRTRRKKQEKSRITLRQPVKRVVAEAWPPRTSQVGRKTEPPCSIFTMEWKLFQSKNSGAELKIETHGISGRHFRLVLILQFRHCAVFTVELKLLFCDSHCFSPFYNGAEAKNNPGFFHFFN